MGRADGAVSRCPGQRRARNAIALRQSVFGPPVSEDLTSLSKQHKQQDAELGAAWPCRLRYAKQCMSRRRLESQMPHSARRVLVLHLGL